MRIFPINHKRRLVLLPPASLNLDVRFGRVDVDASRYWRLLSQMQRLRGSIYLQDGAITESELDHERRHVQAADLDSWHILSVDLRDRVSGCARYRHYTEPVRFAGLGVSKAALARCTEWGSRLKAAVVEQIEEACYRGLNFVEVGGWALAEELRHSTDALRVALSMYALAQLLGGSIGLTTATVRHSSSSILRKIGGAPLVADGAELPRYFDPQYRCEMEILRFDSARPNERCRAMIDAARQELTVAEIVTAVPAFVPAFVASGEMHLAGRRSMLEPVASLS